MGQNFNLTDVGNAISEAIDTPTAKIIRSGSIGVLGVVNPVAGIVGGIGDNLLSEYNTFKLSHLLNGLSTGLNIEQRLNQLYNYVTSSPGSAVAYSSASCPVVISALRYRLTLHLKTRTS